MMTESRLAIIRSVKTPLGFFTLVVLVAELILGGLAARASGFDFTLIIIGMLALLFGLVIAVFAMARNNRGAEHQVQSDYAQRKFDIFLSSVLAGFADDKRLQEEKSTAMTIVDHLERSNFSVYYAGRHVTTASDFDGTHIGAKHDIEALSDSRYFLMLYPERVASSVIFEAGYAFEHCELSAYLVRDQDDLPYLMRRLPEVDDHVRIWKFKQVEDIVRMIEQHKQSLFTWKTVPE